MKVHGAAIGIDENGVEYDLTAYDMENRLGYCELENMIGRDWCRFKTIIVKPKTTSPSKGKEG